jgi:hypothetical protein
VDTSKVGVGETIAGFSALALFIFMFLPWYGIDAVGGFGVGDLGGDLSAWEAFSFIDILLFLAVVAVIGLVLAIAADATPELPVPAGQIIAIAGGIALILVLFRLIFAPGLDTSGFEIDVDLGRKFGIFLGLIATAGITYGGWRAMSEPVAASDGATGIAPPTPAPTAPPTPAPTAPSEPAPTAPPTPTAPSTPPASSPPDAPPEGEPPAGGQPPQQ